MEQKLDELMTELRKTRQDMGGEASRLYRRSQAGGYLGAGEDSARLLAQADKIDVPISEKGE